MRYRVEQLAAACEVSVDTVRYYQSRGLLPAPERQGRVAWYTNRHADRIMHIRQLQRARLPLDLIGRMLDGAIRASDADLATAVASAQADEEEFLTLEELAERSGVPTALLRAIEREGLPLSRNVDGEKRYTVSDVEIVRVGLSMLEAGLPLGELLALARRHDEAMRPIAASAVALFDTYVRQPIHETARDDEDAAERLVAAFRELLPAVTKLVAHHFRRVLLTAAEEHIEAVGDTAELAAKRAAQRRRLESVPNG